MEWFACIMLILILIGIQQLIAYLIRILIKSTDTEEDICIAVFILILGLVSWGCLYYLVIWMYPLII